MLIVMLVVMLILTSIVAIMTFIFLKKYNNFNLLIIIFIALPIVKIMYEYKIKNKMTYLDYIVEVFFIYIPTVIVNIYVNRDKIINYIKNVPIEIHNTLKSDFKLKEEEFNNLATVTRRFLNSGKYDRNKLFNAFKVSLDDYFCILKSVENLEFLYEKKKKIGYTKTLGKFPLGNLLKNIKGVVQPFHNMDVYFIPYTSLGNYGNNYKKYLEKEIVSNLQNERTEYLEKLRKPLRLTQQEFDMLKITSFSLLSFQMDNNNIYFRSENNVLTDDIVKLLQKNKHSLSEVTTEIKDYITSEDILSTLRWESVVDIKNPKYLKFLNKKSNNIAKDLAEHEIKSVFEIVKLSEEEFKEILNKNIGRYKGISPRICSNISKEIIKSIKMTIDILNKAGLNIKTKEVA